MPTLADYGLLIIRIGIGAVFIAHGWPKIRTPKGMASEMGWPTSAVIMLGLAEFLGGLGSLLGIFTQSASLLIMVTMIGALYYHIFKWKSLFISSEKTGWDFAVSMLLSALALYLLGPGSIVVGW